MKNIILVIITALALAACNGGPNRADLQRKIDSVLAVENMEHLRLQGINIEEGNPLQEFYDSLNIQSLPLRSSEDYVRLLPNFSPVPIVFSPFFQQDNATDLRAVALPEMLGIRLMLLAVASDNDYSIWLYSLDSDYMVVDKLMLYAPNPNESDNLMRQFVIDNDYVITLQYYDSTNGTVTQRRFTISDSRNIVHQQ